MLDFNIKTLLSGEKILETSLSGDALLNSPQLNKGTAFTKAEREQFGLGGKLPPQIETIEAQAERAYRQYQSYATPKQKNLFLVDLHATNQVLFYKLAAKYVEEMTPIIYTPHVATFCQNFSDEFRRPEGLYLSYKDKGNLAKILDNRSLKEIDLIVVTDGERILGIGDQGIGGMGIPLGKLMLYSLFGGINPLKTLPIVLDVGTNNKALLENPHYLGLKMPRLRGEQYDKFIQEFVTTIKEKLPRVFLQWEDFGGENAPRILKKYRDELCSFNDDIQGTAVVTLAAILAAVKTKGETIRDQRIIFFGAGSAATGIAELLCNAMVRDGLSLETARKNFWLVNKEGLMTEKYPEITSEQRPFLRGHAEVVNWEINNPKVITLYDTIKHVKPTILIGCSTVGGAFTKEAVKEMARHTKSPIIFPLSNPTANSEATPQDLINWTEGRALIATGSPFEGVNYEGKTYTIAQCNNSFVFPGIGLGTVAVKAKKVSDEMLWVASQTLLHEAPSLQDPSLSLLPAIKFAPRIGVKIGYAVAAQAIKENLATTSAKDPQKLVDEYHWEAKYFTFRKRD